VETSRSLSLPSVDSERLGELVMINSASTRPVGMCCRSPGKSTLSSWALAKKSSESGLKLFVALHFWQRGSTTCSGSMRTGGAVAYFLEKKGLPMVDLKRRIKIAIYKRGLERRRVLRLKPKLFGYD
jgi:hypothetical protein